MGCPDIYYKEALMAFVNRIQIVLNRDREQEEPLRVKNNVRDLENKANEFRTVVSERRFYFEAGVASEQLLESVAMNNGCDALNAALGGISAFEDFIFQEEDEDD